MSAFMVTQKHIGALVQAAIEGPAGVRDWRTFMLPGANPSRYVAEPDADAIGQMLTDENVASLKARYPRHSHDVAPFVYGATYLLPSGHYAPRLPIIAVLKLLDGYEYQACEHDAWDASHAKAFCSQLRSYCIPYLPGYDDAPWTI